MKRLVFLTLILIAAPALSHDAPASILREVMDDAVDRAAERADDAIACQEARLFGDVLNGLPLDDPDYRRIWARADEAYDSCERGQEEAINEAF